MVQAVNGNGPSQAACWPSVCRFLARWSRASAARCPGAVILDVARAGRPLGILDAVGQQGRDTEYMHAKPQGCVFDIDGVDSGWESGSTSQTVGVDERLH